MSSNPLMTAKPGALALPRPLLRPHHWSTGAAASTILHLAAGAAIILVSMARSAELTARPDATIDIDLGVGADAPKMLLPGHGGGGGAGGAQVSPVPLPPTTRPVAPAIPPELIEPVKGAAPVASSPAVPPVGYGAGFGGGMGGGIGGGTGSSLGNGAGDLAPPPAPPKVSARYDKVSTARYTSLIVYPMESRQENEQGTGLLQVIITREGKVLSWKLTASTGKDRLDAEIRRVARLVRALDPLPGDFPAERVAINIKIVFRLNTIS